MINHLNSHIGNVRKYQPFMTGTFRTCGLTEGKTDGWKDEKKTPWLDARTGLKGLQGAKVADGWRFYSKRILPHTHTQLKLT